MRSVLSERAGRIINIASVVALTGYGGPSVCSASKASLLGSTRSLSRKAGQLGITVNAMAPRFIDTDTTQQLPPAQRVADPIDVARSVTGSVITVDAGTLT